MRNNWVVLASVATILAVGGVARTTLQGHVSAATHPAPPAQRLHLNRNFANLPLAFEVNQGQTASPVRFLSRGPGYGLFLTPTEAVLSLQAGSADLSPSKHVPHTTPLRRTPASVVRMQLVGANHNPRTSGVDELPGKSNYFIGNDHSKWRRNIANYRKVQYDDVYPGIDLIYYGNQQQLEYDFVVRPGAKPSSIRMNFAGARHLSIDHHGQLMLDTGHGTVVQHAPRVYQTINGHRIILTGRYVAHGHKIGFNVVRYDPARKLVIDPVLVYSTYLGGSGSESINAIAADNSGDVYATGTTTSLDFPTQNALQPSFVGGSSSSDVFILKLDTTTSALAYSTYLGGSFGPQNGQAIAVDSSGNAYVGGDTQASDFPTQNPLQANNAGGLRDAFVAELNASGSTLIYSTYLGGGGQDQIYGLALDSSAAVYVCGYTQSGNFPTVNALQANQHGSQDGFVAKINSTGSALLYSTYLGGSLSDVCLGIAVDTAGNAYVTGDTVSTDFPTKNPIQATLQPNYTDAFVSKLDATGSTLVYSTYIGGTLADQGNGIVVDSGGNAYVTGFTHSPDFPTANPYQPTLGTSRYNGLGVNAFVLKLNAAGSSILYSTFLGGSGGDFGTGIAVDSAGDIYCVWRYRLRRFSHS